MESLTLLSDPLAPFVLVISSVLGLVIGSFLNVVIWRIPRDESVVSPPSACPKCGTEIKWFDNIPVVSWLVLRAKCRSCSNPISWRYPVVELLTGIVFLCLAVKALASSTSYVGLVSLLPLLYVGAAGVALTLIDLDTHKLPNKIVLPAYPIVFTLLALTTLSSHSGDIGDSWRDLFRILVGCVVLYCFYFVLCVVGGMGFGDVKLAGILGMSLAYYGWEYLIIGAFLPFLLGGIFSVVLLLSKKAGRKSGIPFGPWMILGWFTALFVSEPISSWYLNLMF